MSAEQADARDAELILRLYELRREPVMRQSRDDVFGKFLPKSWEDAVAVQKREHPLNVAYRMVSSYWEMAAGLVKHGALNLDLFAENCGEGLALYAKMLPHVERLRKDYAPTAYANIEWVVSRSAEAKRRLEIFQRRFAAPKA